MNEHLEIREIQREDAAVVSLLSEQLCYDRSAEDLAIWIEELASMKDRQAVFVACFDGEVVGWIEVSLERRLQSPTYALIGGLVVSDLHRGRGLGTLLCEHAERWSWSHGVTTVRVTSRSTRERAHQFYLRNGYEPVKTSLVFEKHRRPGK